MIIRYKAHIAHLEKAAIRNQHKIQRQLNKIQISIFFFTIYHICILYSIDVLIVLVIFIKNRIIINKFTTMNPDHDIVLIRHARSTFNDGTIKASKQLGIQGMWWYDMLKNDQFNKMVTYNKQFIDAPLSQEGIKQCQEVRENLKDMKIDMILVSPYRRTLQTCSLLFPDIQNKIPVIVEPLVAEIYRFACDVSTEIQPKTQKYSGYDFSKIQKLGEDYSLEILSKNVRDSINTKFQQQNAKNFEEKQKILLQSLADGSLSESAADMRMRAVKIKQIFTQYQKKYPVIAVVSHFHTIQFLKSQGFKQDGDLIEYQNVLNCNPYFEKLQELKKIN